MTTAPAGRRTGRPRDASIDARALDAARSLLVEEGFSATTIQAVAERSGVHASALYRRWPSRLELIEEAAFGDPAPGRVRPTGDLGRDLRRFLRAYVATFEAPVARAAVRGLLDSDRPAGRPRSREAWARLSVRPQFRDILAAAPPGAVDPAIDPDDAFELVLGAVLVRVMVPEDARPRPPIGHTVDLLVRLLAGPARG